MSVATTRRAGVSGGAVTNAGPGVNGATRFRGAAGLAGSWDAPSWAAPHAPPQAVASALERRRAHGITEERLWWVGGSGEPRSMVHV